MYDLDLLAPVPFEKIKRQEAKLLLAEIFNAPPPAWAVALASSLFACGECKDLVEQEIEKILAKDPPMRGAYAAKQLADLEPLEAGWSVPPYELQAAG